MQQAKQNSGEENGVNLLYFTSDCLAFFEEQNAINHASGLEDKTITTKTREEVEAEVAELYNDNWEDILEFDPIDELYIE